MAESDSAQASDVRKELRGPRVKALKVIHEKQLDQSVNDHKSWALTASNVRCHKTEQILTN